MKSRFYTHEQLVNVARLQPEDIEQIRRRRRPHNRLGFGYQLCFVRLTNRFPAQKPFEIYEDILSFASVQLDIPASVIDTYASRQPTISEHQDHIREYLGLRRFDENEIPEISKFVFDEACRL
jgi:TnpA family transposase